MYCFKNPANDKEIIIFGDHISIVTSYDSTIIAPISELDNIATTAQIDDMTKKLILSAYEKNKVNQDAEIYFDLQDSQSKMSPRLVASVTRNLKMIDMLLNSHVNQVGDIIASRGDLASDHYLMMKFLHNPNESVLIGLSQNPNLSPRFMVHLANSEYQRVRANIAKREDAPSKLIKMLSQDNESFYVRQVIASRANLPFAIMKQLSKDGHRIVRFEIAKRKDLPTGLAEDMILNDDIEVRKSLLNVWHLTPALIQKAFDCSPEHHEQFVNLLINRGDIPQDWIPTASFDSILKIHKVGKEDLDEESMVELAKNGTLKERMSLASREGKLPDSVISLLAQDESLAVRERFAEYAEYLPNEVLLALAQDPFEGTRIEIASRDELPANVIEILVNDESEAVREHIACRVDLTIEQIVKLSHDVNIFAVANLATYRQLSDDIIERLAQHSSNIIKERLIDHQILTEKAINILANDKNAYIREALAKYSGELPLSCLSQLSDDAESSVRIAIAKRDSLPNDDILLKLLNDPERKVRKTVCDQFCLDDNLIQEFLAI